MKYLNLRNIILVLAIPILAWSFILGYLVSKWAMKYPDENNPF